MPFGPYRVGNVVTPSQLSIADKDESLADAQRSGRRLVQFGNYLAVLG